MRRKSVIALALMGALTLATTPAIAKPKPTLAEIEADRFRKIEPGKMEFVGLTEREREDA